MSHQSETAVFIDPDAQQRRRVGATFAGGVAAIASFFGADFWINNKMLTFDSKIADLTRADIMSRTQSGIGASLDSSDIRLKHTLDLLKSGEHKFAKFVYLIGGKTNFALGAALAIGGVAAVAFFTLVPRKKEIVTYANTPAIAAIEQRSADGREHAVESEKGKEWEARVDREKEETKTVTAGR